MTQNFDGALLRKAFGSFPTGVTIVTTRDGDAPVGFTANSFASVSLNPPMLLFCIDKSSDSADLYRSAPRFAVNVLSGAQKELSTRFSTGTGDRFDGIEWQWSPEGNPVITGAVSHFNCETGRVVDAGDHLVIIGTVASLETGDGPSLGFHRGRYIDMDP